MKVDSFSREVHRRICALPTPKDPDPTGMVLAIADQVATEWARTNRAGLLAFTLYCESKRRRRNRRG